MQLPFTWSCLTNYLCWNLLNCSNFPSIKNEHFPRFKALGHSHYLFLFIDFSLYVRLVRCFMQNKSLPKSVYYLFIGLLFCFFYNAWKFLQDLRNFYPLKPLSSPLPAPPPPGGGVEVGLPSSMRSIRNRALLTSSGFCISSWIPAIMELIASQSSCDVRTQFSAGSLSLRVSSRFLFTSTYDKNLEWNVTAV